MVSLVVSGEVSFELSLERAFARQVFASIYMVNKRVVGAGAEKADCGQFIKLDIYVDKGEYEIENSEGKSWREKHEEMKYGFQGNGKPLKYVKPAVDLDLFMSLSNADGCSVEGG